MILPHPMDDHTGFADPSKYDCDCCGKHRRCSRVWAMGIETFACDECRGIDPADYGEEREP